MSKSTLMLINTYDCSLQFQFLPFTGFAWHRFVHMWQSSFGFVLFINLLPSAWRCPAPPSSRLSSPHKLSANGLTHRFGGGLNVITTMWMTAWPIEGLFTSHQQAIMVIHTTIIMYERNIKLKEWIVIYIPRYLYLYRRFSKFEKGYILLVTV